MNDPLFWFWVNWLTAPGHSSTGKPLVRIVIPIAEQFKDVIYLFFS